MSFLKILKKKKKNWKLWSWLCYSNKEESLLKNNDSQIDISREKVINQLIFEF